MQVTCLLDEEEMALPEDDISKQGCTMHKAMLTMRCYKTPLLLPR